MLKDLFTAFLLNKILKKREEINLATNSNSLLDKEERNILASDRTCCIRQSIDIERFFIAIDWLESDINLSPY